MAHFPDHSVTIHVPAGVTLDQSNKILARTLGKLGCDGCHSGFDFRFLRVRDFVVNPKTLDVQEFSAGFGH